MGEHGYRNVTFHQKIMIFDGGGKAEVLSENAVWGIKEGKDCECLTLFFPARP